MKIFIAGDTHGRFLNLSYLQEEVIKQYPDCEACIQVGDFGLYPQLMDRLNKDFSFPLKTYVIDGNHEDHRWLQRIKQKGHYGKWERNNIFFMERATYIKIGSSTIGFLGGAMNVDRPNTGSEELCYNNYVSDKDVKKAINVFNKNKLDLLITHSCPTRINVGVRGSSEFIPGVKMFISDPFNLPIPPLHDCGEAALKDLWNGLEVKPKNWMFGHFHSYHDREVENTRFICVGSSDRTTHVHFALPFIYDTETKGVEVGEKIAHMTSF